MLRDVHLPGIDGLKATRRIPAEAGGIPGRPVVFLLSAYEVADYAGQTTTCGASACLPECELTPATVWAAWSTATQPANQPSG